MNLLEKFLNTDLTISNNELIDLFNQVVEEIRTEELGVSKDYFLKFGDSEALDIINKNSIQGLCFILIIYHYMMIFQVMSMNY